MKLNDHSPRDTPSTVVQSRSDTPPRPDHSCPDTQGASVHIAHGTQTASDHPTPDAQKASDPADRRLSPKTYVPGQLPTDAQFDGATSSVPPHDPLPSPIDRIVALSDVYRYCTMQANGIKTRALSRVRTAMGYSPKLEHASKIVAAAQKAYRDGVKGEGEYVAVVARAEEAQEGFLLDKKAAEKARLKLAAELPVAEWVGSVKGFGLGNLCNILGETGDLDLYDNPAKVWKRMGVAVIDGIAQGKLPKNAPAELWIEHGYVRYRRSTLWTLGDCLIKKQNDYRELYLQRKEHEAAREEVKTPMHAHRRAQRYMEKRALRDLWCHWTGREDPWHA